MLRDIIHRTQKMLKDNFSIQVTGDALENYLRVEGSSKLAQHIPDNTLILGDIPEYDANAKPTERATKMFYSPYEAGLFETYIGFALCKVLIGIMESKTKASCPSIGLSMHKQSDTVKVSFDNAITDKG